MKHLLQNLENGETTIIDIPAPEVEDGHLLIETTVSLVSPGTEKMLIDFGNLNLWYSARTCRPVWC